MPRFWIIAPIENGDQYDSVWEFDLVNRCISIGWRAVGDVSSMTKEELRRKVEDEYPNGAHTLITNMIWSFYHEIAEGDVIIARRGLSFLSAVGDVEHTAQFLPDKTPNIDHPHYLTVSWRASPRNKQYGRRVFQMRAVVETTQEAFNELLRDSEQSPSEATASESQQRFVLETYLEDFIVSNWGAIFQSLEVFIDQAGKDGQQYNTTIGRIDILAVDRNSRDFVVIELKRDKSSDQVVGQVLRYMGWVKKHLCDSNQSVRGLIICSEADPKLNYALSMVEKTVSVQYYEMSFKLKDGPARVPEL